MAEEQKEAPTMEDIPKISVFTPIIYVSILLGVFVVFLVVYRKKRLRKLQAFEPLFGPNRPAELYDFMKMQAINPGVPKEQKPHEKVLKAALLRRGVEAVRRLMKLKEFEPTFTRLYQEGLIGDDIHQQYGIQVKFQELELQDIVKDVEGFKKGWAQTFFPTAQEICFNEALRRRLYAMDDRKQQLSELWHYHVSELEKKLSQQSPVKSKTEPKEKVAEKVTKKVAEKPKVVEEKAEKVVDEKPKVEEVHVADLD